MSIHVLHCSSDGHPSSKRWSSKSWSTSSNTFQRPDGPTRKLGNYSLRHTCSNRSIITLRVISRATVEQFLFCETLFQSGHPHRLLVSISQMSPQQPWSSAHGERCCILGGQRLMDLHGRSNAGINHASSKGHRLLATRTRNMCIGEPPCEHRKRRNSTMTLSATACDSSFEHEHASL